MDTDDRRCDDSPSGRSENDEASGYSDCNAPYELPSGPTPETFSEEKKEDPGDMVSCEMSADDRSVDTSAMEAKVQILYTQLEQQAKMIKQLKSENAQTKEDAEFLEKECSECMQELSEEVDGLKEMLQERDELISSLRSKTSAETNGEQDEGLLAEIEDLYKQLEERDTKIEELEENQVIKDETVSYAELRAQVEALEAKLKQSEAMIEGDGSPESVNNELIEHQKNEIHGLKAKVAELEETCSLSDDQKFELNKQLKEAQDECERLSFQVKEKGLRIENLEEKEQMNSSLLKQREEDVDILNEQLTVRDQKIKEKDMEMEALTEKNVINSSMLKQKEDDVEILYEQVENRDRQIKELEEQVELYSGANEILQEREAAFAELTTEAQDLKEQLEQRDSEMKKLRESYKMYHSETTESVLELNQLLANRDTRIGQLEQENKLNDELIKVLRSFQNQVVDEDANNVARSEKDTEHTEMPNAEHSELHGQSQQEKMDCQQIHVKVEELTALLHQKTDSGGSPEYETLEIKERLEERNAECLELQSKIEVLSTELNILLQEKAETHDDKESTKELQNMLEAEQSRCEQLNAQMESLTLDLQDRAQKVTALGFDSDDQLLNAYIDIKQKLAGKERETELPTYKLGTQRLQQGNNGDEQACTPDDKTLTQTNFILSDTLTDMSERNYRADGHGEATLGHLKSEEIQTLLAKEREQSEKLRLRAHSLKTDVKDWESLTFFGNHSPSNLVEDVKSLCTHISTEAECFIAYLEEHVEMNRNLIQTLGTSRYESFDIDSDGKKNTESRAGVIIDSMRETELLGSKVENLLEDVKDRDGKLQTLEWLTVDLSKALENKTAEIAEFESSIKAEKEEKKELQEKVDLLLKDAEGRESRIQDLKKKIAELEASLSQSKTQQEGLQTLVNSLTETLEEEEKQVKSLSSELESKNKFIKMQETQLQQELKEKGETDSRYSELQERLDEKDRICGELLADVESLEDMVKDRERHIEELELEASSNLEITDSLKAQMNESENEYNWLLSEVESLRGNVNDRHQQIRTLQDELASSAESVEGLNQQLKDMENRNAEVNSLEGVLKDKNNQVEALQLEKKATVERSEELEQRLQETTSQLEGINEQYAELCSNFESQRGRTKELEDEVASKENELAKVRLEVQHQQDQAKHLEQELSLHKEQYNKVLSDAETEGRQLKELEQDMTLQKEQYSKLLSDYEDHKKETTALEEELAQRQEQRDKFTSEIEYLKAQRKELEQKVIVKEDQNAKLYSDINSQQNKIEELKQAVAEKEDQKTELLSDVDCCRSQLNQLEQELAVKGEENAELHSEVASQRNRLMELEKEVSVKDEVFQEIGFIEEMLGEQKTRCLDLSTEMETLENKLAGKEMELKCARQASKKHSQVVEELRQKHKEVERIQEQCDELNEAAAALRQELQGKKQELEAKDKAIDSLREELHQTRQNESPELEERLQEQILRYDQLSANMDSVSNKLEERENQIEGLQKEVASKDKAITTLQWTIQEKTDDIESLLEEHEVECTELQAKLDSMNSRLSARSEGGESEIKEAYLEATQNLQGIQDQLEELGFTSMNELVQGIAEKCREHAAMEMQIGILQEEIAGKDKIIQDMTLRLNQDIATKHQQAFEEKMKNKGEPGFETNSPKHLSASASQNRRVSFDETEAKYGKAASKIEAMAYLLKDREATIQKLQQEVEAKERAINALVRGLEFNVQEKIQSDKLVHENKTKCSEFASQVQNLAKELEARDQILGKLGKNARPMRRNLASLEEIKSLSPEELVDLLTASRVLAEDLEAERERLIANATNMSIALAESRCKVDKLTEKLDAANAAGGVHSARKPNSKGAKPAKATGSKSSGCSRTGASSVAEGSLISDRTGRSVQSQEQSLTGAKSSRKKRGSIFKRV